MAPPVRTDKEIVPRNRWVQIGKSNCYLDLDKKQSNPIYKMAVDLLMHTNFHRSFTSSSTIPSIYIQQIWDIIQYDKKAGSYRCQLDEQWFVLTKDTLREALQITPINNNQAFVAPPSTDVLFDFVNELGYPKLRRHKFHPRPDSSLHLPNEEPVLGYLKFSANGSKREVFGMHIPGSHLDSPASIPTKPARKPKLTSPKAPPRHSVSILVTSAQPAPTSASAKLQEKKPESEAEDDPFMEPKIATEDAELQKVLEESMKTAYAAAPRGPLPPVVIREPESGKYQPLSEVPGKGKAKVTEEQSDSKEESDKVVLGATKGCNDEDQAGPDPVAQAEGQTGINAGTLDEGQAGSNPDEMSEGQAGPDPGIAGDEEQSILSPVVHAGSDLEEHGLLEDPTSSSGTISSLQYLSRDISFGDQLFSDKPSDTDKNAETKVESKVNVPIQQALSSISLMTLPLIDLTSRPESPKVHQQFKATITDTTTTTTTTLQPPQAQQKSIAEAMMVKRIGKLEHIMANLIQVNKDMEERLDKHGACLYTLEQLDIPQQVSIAVSEVVTDAVDWAMQAPLCNRFRDLPKADMKEILHQRMWETESYKTHEDHKQLFEALEKSMNRDHSEELAQDLAKARKKKKKIRESPKMPPGQESPSKGSATPSPSKTAASAEYQAWTTTDIRLRLSISLTPADLEMDEDMALASNYSPPPEDSLLAQTGDMATFIDWFYKRRGITELKPQDLEGPAFEIIKVFHPDVIHLQYQMEECHKLLTNSVDDPILRNNVSKPLPPGGPPGQVTIQSDFFFNKDLEYLRYGSKGSKPALSISKMKAAYYPNAGLEQMMMMRFNEIHKFSDGTLQQIDEALDYRVKEFRINRTNPGLNTRFWTRKDVDRCKAFMFAIQRRLRTRRIFHNLGSFVGGRVREGDYRLLKRTE
nr:monodehydroascorbate reductase [Tanacetum cinerariifolium]